MENTSTIVILTVLSVVACFVLYAHMKRGGETEVLYMAALIIIFVAASEVIKELLTEEMIWVSKNLTSTVIFLTPYLILLLCFHQIPSFNRFVTNKILGPKTQS